AEDGIRDFHVTGVQTCALPILLFPLPFVKDQRSLRTTLFVDVGNVFDTNCSASQKNRNDPSCDIDIGNMASSVGVGLTWITALRSEERRVGKESKGRRDGEQIG